MADSLALVLQSTALNQPRVHFYGLPSDSQEAVSLQARLPNLVDVRVDAERAVELLKEPPPAFIRALDRDGTITEISHPAIIYHYLLPGLTMFAYLCREEDVPDDLQDLCIWALKQRLEAVRKGSDNELRMMLRDPATRRVETYAKTLMEYQTLSMLIDHLMSPRINQPEEAIPYYEACFQAEKLNPQTKDSFTQNPKRYVAFGAALARTKSRDAEAKEMLEQAVNDIDKVSINGAKTLFIQAKLYLARVLRRIGELEEAKKHESYLITWFRKNRNILKDAVLREWFLTENANDPVFDGLGGLKWLQKDKPTWKSVDRSARSCFKCGLQEGPANKMLRCSKCQYTFYCSRECQVKDYPSHKVSCKEHAKSLEHAQLVKSISAEDGKCMEDWNKYKVYTYGHRVSVHALGLKHTPTRGLTHIVVRSVKYVPNGGKDILDRFEVIAAGVFAISDILGEIDTIMGYNPGEAKQVIGDLIEDFYQGIGRNGTAVPNFDWLISDDKRLGSYLSIGQISRSQLAEINYNPNWRGLLNPGKNVTVKQLILKCGAKDAEFDYYRPSQSSTHNETESKIVASSNSLSSLD
ncbi:hypothetical protein L218DRAFT_1076950 [Marasmius fiardii PR-910]|nr:hypothetical protein L218DRAFT_1076950 [Marasmius fiardii PR-910]